MADRKRLCILTIAGSDSGAGAGIQADARVVQALGGYAATAITAVTAQNTRGVKAWKAVLSALIAAQISAVLEDLPVTAIKTGLLPGASAVRAVAKALSLRPRLPLVIDPVIGSTSGTRFLSAVGLRALKRELFPLATLVTPNRPEAAALTGLSVRTDAQAEKAALLLAKEYGCTVLVKGGHASGPTCRDCLATPSGRVRWFESPRLRTRNTHGTGCVLSAAIAFELAAGHGLEIAIGRARRFLFKALEKGGQTRWGAGYGPAFNG